MYGGSRHILLPLGHRLGAAAAARQTELYGIARRQSGRSVRVIRGSSSAGSWRSGCSAHLPLHFLRSVSVVAGVVQYNLDNRDFEGGPPPPTVPEMCRIMTNATFAPYDAYVALQKCVGGFNLPLLCTVFAVLCRRMYRRPVSVTYCSDTLHLS